MLLYSQPLECPLILGFVYVFIPPTTTPPAFRFTPPEDGSDNVKPHVLLNLDLSASYLIAADSSRKVCDK